MSRVILSESEKGYCTVVILLTKTHQLMDNFIQMDGNCNKTGHDKGINTKGKNIPENQKKKEKF